jgi:glucose-1-phosphate cytidylyltransferase
MSKKPNRKDIPVVILAGGLGTRLAEETEIKPKPMVEIGSEPILWHIMSGYAHFGFKEFFIALGYKGEMIKEYFLDRTRLKGDITIDMASQTVNHTEKHHEDWRLHLIDTGQGTQTGGRLKRLEPYLKKGTFMLTYGDGVSNVDLRQVLKFHRSKGKFATITAVRPPARFGGIVFQGDLIAEFTEKPQIGEGWINGGFMVLEPAVFDYLEGDMSVLEVHLLERLASDHQLAAFRHDGFWQCMDTLRDKHLLNTLWSNKTAPWKVWG